MRMLTRILVAFAVLLAAPKWGEEGGFVHNADPLARCESVSDITLPLDRDMGLDVLKCHGETEPTEATWMLRFDLGRTPMAYDTFTLHSGYELDTLGRPRAEVDSCEGDRCTYYSAALIRIPFQMLFSPEVKRDGLDIKAAGGPTPLRLYITPERIAALRQALIAAEFIQADI